MILLTATMTGFVAGFVAFAGGASPAGAIFAGGGAFSTATLVLLAIAHFADGQQR
jgi:hypothetical protein